MTIFLKVLQQLIAEKLTPLSVHLKGQSQSFNHNSRLSLDQKEIVDKLQQFVIRFNSTGDDKKDLDSIIQEVDQRLKALKDKRDFHRQARDSGNTVDTMTKLSIHAKELYIKLTEYGFPLLNKAYTETPEGIVYYHSVYYFGEELFSPNKHIDTKIRATKEQKLEVRLHQLSKLIQPNSTLEQRRVHALQILEDLARDNVAAIQSDKAFYNVPGLSFWGWQVTMPSQWFAPGRGRFDQQFSQAVRKVEEMTAETYKPGGVLPEPIESLPLARAVAISQMPPPVFKSAAAAAAAAVVTPKPELAEVVDGKDGEDDGDEPSDGSTNSM